MKDFIVLPDTIMPNEADDLDGAELLAKQLATSQPGESFSVYERVSTSRADKPTMPAVVPTTTRKQRGGAATEPEPEPTP
jgi:hypothetical protein